MFRVEATGKKGAGQLRWGDEGRRWNANEKRAEKWPRKPGEMKSLGIKQEREEDEVGDKEARATCLVLWHVDEPSNKFAM